MEAIAEKELLAAVKAIEEAAKQLLAAKNAPRPPKPPGQIDVTGKVMPPAITQCKFKLVFSHTKPTGPIMDAASSIADAAAHLMRAASEAQKERVAQGKLPNSSSAYKR